MERFNSEEVIHTSGYVQPAQSNKYEYQVTNPTTFSTGFPLNEMLVDGSQESVDNYSTVLGWLIDNYPETYNDFVDQQAEQFELFCKKHKDYGTSTLLKDTVQESVEDILKRIKEKANRVFNLNNKNSVPENESLIDSLNDISNYANISIIFLKGHWGK